jgi:hypothetical protein
VLLIPVPSSQPCLFLSLHRESLVIASYEAFADIS